MGNLLSYYLRDIPENFIFNERAYNSQITDINDLDHAFNLYIESNGKDYIFKAKSGEIWIISIHFDRHKELNNELVECKPPTNIDPKPDGRYLWSSFNNENSWDNYIINDGFGPLFNFFRGDVYLVATKLNDLNTPVCFIDSSEKLIELSKTFGVGDHEYQKYEYDKNNIDWPSFYKKYGSLIILNYYWKHRLSIHWYYGFDCTTVLNLKIKSIDGSPIVNVRKLSNHEINKIYYDKLLPRVNFNLYTKVLRMNKYHVLYIFMYDSLVKVIRGDDSENSKHRDIYYIIRSNDTDIIEPTHLLQESLTYDFARTDIKYTPFYLEYFNLTKLARAHMIMKLIIDPTANQRELVNFVNNHYYIYKFMNLLDINKFQHVVQRRTKFELIDFVWDNIWPSK